MNTFAVSFLVRPSKSTKAFFIAFKTDTTVTKANHLSRNKKNNFCPAYLNTCRTKVIHSRLHHAQKQSVRFHLLIKRLLNQLHDIIQFIHIRNTDFYIALPHRPKLDTSLHKPFGSSISANATFRERRNRDF